MSEQPSIRWLRRPGPSYTIRYLKRPRLRPRKWACPKCGATIVVYVDLSVTHYSPVWPNVEASHDCPRPGVPRAWELQ